MKILFLYTELAGYFLSCVEALVHTQEAEVMILRWPVNEEAPFDFHFPKGVIVHDRADFTPAQLQAVCEAFAPELVFVTGWLDKGYLRVARHFRRRGVPVVGGMDNQWTGSLKQRIATWISPLYVRRFFDVMWVAGLRQYEYARRLGFGHQAIRMGYYSAGVAPFQEAGEKCLAQKEAQYPHTFLYVGRLLAHKGVFDLCEAFVDTADQHDWSLTLVGKGEIENRFKDHPRIQVRDFVQPDQLPALAAEAGVFVLPSRHEPWGVVLHEFAAAGLPLLVSDACGAADAFLRTGYNGLVHRAGDRASLRHTLLAITRLTDPQLLQMGQRSTQLSRQITPESWAATLAQLKTQNS